MEILNAEEVKGNKFPTCWLISQEIPIREKLIHIYYLLKKHFGPRWSDSHPSRRSWLISFWFRAYWFWRKHWMGWVFTRVCGLIQLALTLCCCLTIFNTIPHSLSISTIRFCVWSRQPSQGYSSSYSPIRGYTQVLSHMGGFASNRNN